MTLHRFSRIAASLALAFCLLLAMPLAFAQTVHIGGTTFELGASRADALGVANAQFEVQPAGVSGQYNIYPKRLRRSGETYPPALGTITIRNNQLVRVTRNLGSIRSNDAETAMDNLITAFARAPSRGNAPSVHTDSSRSGGTGNSRVYFSYPDRTIQIVVYRPANRTSAATIDITEQYALRGQAEPRAVAPPLQR